MPSNLHRRRETGESFTEAALTAIWPERKEPAIGILCEGGSVIGFCICRASASPITTFDIRINYSNVIWLEDTAVFDLEVDPPRNASQFIAPENSGHSDLWNYLTDSSEQVKDILLALARKIEDMAKLLAPFGKSYIDRVALQADAVNTAFRIAKVDPDLLSSYRPSPLPNFLDGVTVREDEDAIIEHDASVSFLAEGVGVDKLNCRTYRFRGERYDITVCNVNKRGGEGVLGTDLVFLNETYKAAVLVQYKMMESRKVDGRTVSEYRPDRMLDEEIRRFRDSFCLNTEGADTSESWYRLSHECYFLKLVSRRSEDGFRPNSLASGMVISLGHFEAISGDESTGKGDRGARCLNWENVPRWLTATDLQTLVSGGWVGTRGHDTYKMAQDIVRHSLEYSRDVVFVRASTRRKSGAA